MKNFEPGWKVKPLNLFEVQKPEEELTTTPEFSKNKSPAQIGWAARFRTIDLITPRNLKGRELLMRTRGWWTVEPAEVLKIVEEHGKLILGDQGELMIELVDHKAVDD